MGIMYLMAVFLLKQFYTTQANLASYSYLKNIPYDATVVSDYETIRYTTDPIRVFMNFQIER